MAQRAILEFDGKKILSKHLKGALIGKNIIHIGKDTNISSLPKKFPWITKERLVVKPDQLIKRRGKSGFLLLDSDYKKASKWINEKRGKKATIGKVTGILESFIIEPFIEHSEKEEHYLAIRSTRYGDEILVHESGGINVGDIDSKAKRCKVSLGNDPTRKNIDVILSEFSKSDRKTANDFIRDLFSVYRNLNFAYLEINPFVIRGGKVHILDLAAKIDDTAEFECGHLWGKLTFHAPFGRDLSKEEEYIKDLDSKTGASLKLTILNHEGRVWTMVAGGGASVVYADTISDLGYSDELANYGEYSGNPSTEFTYLYAKTILDLMTRKRNPKGKVLFIGGGIANFTDVTRTFKGIIKALNEYRKKLIRNKVRIFVRRGGPNYKQGLMMMNILGKGLKVPIEVYGPETHMTAIVTKALEGG